jgi:pyridoxine/pyridoxamine 5'-phosphate oxidase
MSKAQLLAFMRCYRVAVQTSVSPSGAPQAAIVGVAVGDDFEVVFDALQTSRKVQNLRQRPKVALVLGGWGQGEERTFQYEGVADEPSGAELERIRELYFAVYPDGRERLANQPGLIHVRVRPTWLRYSDFGQTPALILELSASELAALR